MKTVLISGASRGIGAETARLFSKNGYAVAINYYKNEQLALDLVNELNSNGGNAHAFYADVSKSQDVSILVEKTLRHFQKIDVLVCNAGISKSNLIIDVSDQEFDNIVSVNQKGVFNLIREVSKSMISRKNGSIVTVASFLGLNGGSCESVYSMTKGGVISLSLALSKELALSNIRVNCVCPGLIDTEMNSNLTDEDKRVLIENTPLNRIGQPIDVARAIKFLAEAEFITGVTLPVTGGLIV